MKTAASASSESSRVLTGRVIVLFVVLMTVMVLWIETSTLVVDSTSFNSLQPSISAVFMLFVVVAVLNPLLRAVWPSVALRGRQLVMLYTMLMVGSPIADIGLVHFLLPSISSSYYFQRPENKWEDMFGEFRPAWAAPQDPKAVREFWESGVSGVPWDLWWRPLSLWLLYSLSMFAVMVCLNLIIRKQWVDRERLTFPLVYLPLEMAQDEEGKGGHLRLVNSFLRNPYTWVGVLLAAIPHTFQGLHVYNPQIPFMEIKSIPLNRYFREPPWNAMGTLTLNLYPCLIGFSYLLTTEVAFSVWFFYLFGKLERVLGRAIGWTGVGQAGMSMFPFEEQQGIGAWIVLIVFGLWISRRYYADVFRAAFGGTVSWMSREDAVTYRWALLGALAGMVAMLVFAAYLGMGLVVGAVFFILYFVFAMALTRIRAEAGLGCISGPSTVQEFLVTLVGTSGFGPRNLTALQHFHWQTVEFRGPATLMPCQLEGLKLAGESKISTRETVAGMGMAILYTAILATYVMMTVVYQHGGISMNNWRFMDVPVTPYKRLASWLTTPQPTNWLSLGFTLLGGAFMAFLTYMRISQVWWPFHPIGFAVTMSKRTVHWTWFPALLAWVLKTNILRYGGYKLYRKLLPLFLGLVLGDFFIGGVFGVAGALIPRPGYCVFP